MSMRIRISSAIFTSIWLGAPIIAQGTFTGPVAGYVFDSAEHLIRPITGIPGAATLGKGIGKRFEVASVAPNGLSALGFTRDSASLVDISDPAQPRRLQGTIDVDEIQWSSDSRTAAVFGRSARIVQRIDVANALAEPGVDLSGLGEIAAWSLSPDGRSIAVIASAVIASPLETASIYLISAGSNTPALITNVAAAGALAFAMDSQSVFAFDPSSQNIFRFQLPAGAVVNAISTRSMRGVRALAATADGQALLAAGSNQLCAVPLAGQSPNCVALDIIPSRIQMMSGGLFLLDAPRAHGHPVWVYDSRRSDVYFIPEGGPTGLASR